ncbi:hypothetical protein OC861_006972, partial [Tilletia horrida]
MSHFSRLPNEVWILIVQAVAAGWPLASRAWSYAPQDHPLIALSQTCKTLQRFTAPFIWSNIAFEDGSPYDDRIALLPRLISRLSNPAACANLAALDLNLKVGRARAGYEYDVFHGPPCAPTYPDVLALLTRLGEALKGTQLRELRLHPDIIHPSDSFLAAVGKGCTHLEHIELAYGVDQLPFAQMIKEVSINGPDQLDRLVQVRSATIGTGALFADDELRELIGDGLCWVQEQAPGLIKWLRGEVHDESSSKQQDNKLVYLKTSASFLYRYRCLAPAWARFNQILDQNDEANAEIVSSFAHGHYIEEEYEPGGDLYDEEVGWVHAASAIRPSLDRLAASRVDDDEIQAQDVIDMVRSDPVFAPWRDAWFSGPGDWDDASGPSTGALSFADEILQHWRKSAQSRREAPTPP